MIKDFLRIGLWSEDIPAREMETWRLLGPWRYRLRVALLEAMLLAIGATAFLAITTLISVYPGAGRSFQGPGERLATAEVGECNRVGPLSVNGFGYWWECTVIVHTRDGRTVNARVRRSIVSPVDRGKIVAVREGCRDAGNSECSYGRPVSRWWLALVLVVDKVRWLVAIAFGLTAIILLARAVLGAPRYFRLPDPLS